MKKVFKIKKVFLKRESKVCHWCGKEKEDFYGDMCSDCMSQ